MFILATDFSLALDSGGKGVLVLELDFSHLILVSFSLILDHEKKAFICEVFVSFLSCFFKFFMFFRSSFFQATAVATFVVYSCSEVRGKGTFY